MRPLPVQPAARLRLAPYSDTPRQVAGAWWPRSRGLLAELPPLLGALPLTWDPIAEVSVHEDMWAPSPVRILVDQQVVRLRKVSGPRGRHVVSLLSPGRARWELLVVPPEIDVRDAERLMSAAAGDHPR